MLDFVDPKLDQRLSLFFRGLDTAVSRVVNGSMASSSTFHGVLLNEITSLP